MVATTPATREEMLRRASALVPRLRERAERTEQLRRLPEETVADLVDAGLLRIGTPARFGGNGLDVDAAFEVTFELGRACGSTAWCYSVLNNHNWMLGHWPEEAQQEYFADSPDTLSSSGFDPGRSRVEVAPGGYRLSGRWSFSSGCDAASWVMVGGLAPGGPHMFLVPMRDATIVDTWHVTGLRGTGSKDVTVDDAFVPSHRVVELRRMRAAETDAWALHGRASYRVPMFALSLGLVGPVIGMAGGAVEAFVEQLHGRKQPGGAAATQAVASQLRLAESSAEADTARGLARLNTRELLDWGARGEPFTMLDRARYRRDQVFMVKLATRAIGRLFEAGGGHVLQESNPLQRFHRDALAAAQHMAIRWDTYAEQYSRVTLGLEPAQTALL
ncbi:MAG: acyl-CoA dehydrogenase family protein [Chloroflexota bacterium]